MYDAIPGDSHYIDQWLKYSSINLYKKYHTLGDFAVEVPWYIGYLLQ